MAVFPFRQETRAALRRRIGRLMFRSNFLYGTATAGSATTATLTEAKQYPTGALVGRVLACTGGTGAGQVGNVTANVVGSGVVTFSPSFTTPLDATSVVEIWPDLTPDAVNDALNTAVQDVADICQVRVDTPNPTLDTTRKIVTLPAGLVKLIDLQVYDSSSLLWSVYRPGRYLEYPREGGNFTFMVRGTSLYLSDLINANVTGANIIVRGYRLPALFAADTDLCEISPSYLVPFAAYTLEAAEAEGPLLDPEQHSGRAANWLRQAMMIRPRIQTHWVPNTIELEV